MKKVLLASLVLGLVALAGPAPAGQDQGQKTRNKSSTNQSQEHAGKQAYLGIGVEPVPDALRSHLHDALPEGQGVLVGEVAPNSPAAKAGLKSHDILVSFDDQKLHSPERLVQLVREGTPGHEVTITYLRSGKQGTCKVTLGDRPANQPEEQQQNMQRPPTPEQFREFFEQFQRRNDNSSFELIDGMKLTRVDKDHWRAEIDYRTKDNKKEHKSFEGTRDEIRKDIQSAKDLPANEKSQLLHSLNLDPSPFGAGFPFGGMQPLKRDDR